MTCCFYPAARFFTPPRAFFAKRENLNVLFPRTSPALHRLPECSQDAKPFCPAFFPRMDSYISPPFFPLPLSRIYVSVHVIEASCLCFLNLFVENFTSPPLPPPPRYRRDHSRSHLPYDFYSGFSSPSHVPSLPLKPATMLRQGP